MRIRRGVLPAAMVGLVGFSFSLVVAGGAGYAASLPSLFDAAYATSEDSLFHAVEAALPSDVVRSFPSASGRPDRESAQKGGGGAPSQGGPMVALASPSGSNDHDGAGSGMSAGQIAIGGLMFASPFTPPVEAGQVPEQGVEKKTEHTDEEEGKPAKQDNPKPQEKPAEQQPSQGSGEKPAPEPEQQQNGGTVPVPQPDPGAPQPAPLPPDQEEREQRYREAIVASYNRVAGYLARAKEVARTFANDCGKASVEQQNADANVAARLQLEAHDEYMAIRDYSPHPDNSRYDEAAGRVIGMYRTLEEFAGYYYNAWCESFDELGTPERLNAQLGKANKAMDEFNSYYQGFTI